MLVHAGKYRTEDKLKTQTIKKLNTTQKKPRIQNTAKQNYSGLVAFYSTRPRLFYNAREPSRGKGRNKTGSKSCRAALGTVSIG